MTTSDLLPDSLHRLAALHKRYIPLTLSAPDEQPGWINVAELSAPDGQVLRDCLARFAAHHPLYTGAPFGQAHASRWWVGYLNEFMITVFGAYLIDSRIPDLRPQAVWVRFDEQGELACMAWTGKQVTAISADLPTGMHSGGDIVTSQDELRDRLHAALLDHLSPLVETLAANSPFGKPGLWALAADYVGKTMLWAARVCGDELHGIEEARRLNRPETPLYRHRDFIPIQQGEQVSYIIDRTACCQKRKLDGRTNCATCPLRSIEERIELSKKGKD